MVGSAAADAVLLVVVGFLEVAEEVGYTAAAEVLLVVVGFLEIVEEVGVATRQSVVGSPPLA